MEKFEPRGIKGKDGEVVNAHIMTDCDVALECKD